MTCCSQSPAKAKNSATKPTKAIQQVIQQFSHSISDVDFSRQFAEGKKETNAAPVMQTGHMPETIFTLGLFRKIGKGSFVR